MRLVNRTGERLLVVLSVDGINAISGETAAVGQSGYVLGPWQRAEITGWRKSETEAAAFYFTALADSYAARTDRPDHVGVIGAAVFREHVRRPRPRELPVAPPAARGNAEPSGDAASRLGRLAEPSADTAATRRDRLAAAEPDAAAESARDGESRAAKAEQRLGTGHGEREFSPITTVAFERASRDPDEVVQVRYDSIPNLVAMGVVRPWRAARLPDPFPRYVPDPR